MTRREFIAVMASGTSLPLLASGCSLFGSSSTFRFRLAVEVATPAGRRSGSSVIESTIGWQRTFTDPHALYYKVRGQAVAVDLPGGTLFALLNNEAIGYDYPSSLLNNALSHGVATPPLSRRYEGYEWAEEQEEARRVEPAIVLQPVDYPTLIRFRDPGDATSMEVVDPTNLAAAFGRGVHLERIVLQVTNDDVTTKIAEQLPSLGRKSGYLRWRKTLARDDVRRDLTYDNFVRNPK